MCRFFTRVYSVVSSTPKKCSGLERTNFPYGRRSQRPSLSKKILRGRSWQPKVRSRRLPTDSALPRQNMDSALLILNTSILDPNLMYLPLPLAVLDLTPSAVTKVARSFFLTRRLIYKHVPVLSTCHRKSPLRFAVKRKDTTLHQL